MRPRRRDITLTLALCLSLTVHAWIVQAAATRYARSYQHLFLPGLTRSPAVTTPVVPPIERRPPPVENPTVPLDPMSRLGDSEGSLTADALAAAPGETSMRAPRADQTQADLSLDDVGVGRGGEAAAAPGAVPPSPQPIFPPGAVVDPAFAVPRDAAPAQPVPDRRAAVEEPGPADQPPPAPGPQKPAVRPPEVIAIGAAPPQDLEAAESAARAQEETAPAASAPEPTPPAAPAAAPAAVPEARPAPQAPPSTPAGAESAADPSPRAESESDAFSTEESADFTSGRTIARIGRKHRLIRPKLEMAGHADLMSMRAPVTVVLRLHLAASGDVEKVEIVQSSGSINVDQPTRLAAYRWWFEPAKDDAGRPKPDVIRFVCRFI